MRSYPLLGDAGIHSVARDVDHARRPCWEYPQTHTHVFSGLSKRVNRGEFDVLNEQPVSPRSVSCRHPSTTVNVNIHLPGPRCYRCPTLCQSLLIRANGMVFPLLDRLLRTLTSYANAKTYPGPVVRPCTIITLPQLLSASALHGGGSLAVTRVRPQLPT